jgi:hypothetical protein
MLRQVVEKLRVMDSIKRRFPGLNSLVQISPWVTVERHPEHRRPAPKRAGDVAAQQLTKRGQSEPSILQLGDDSDIAERSQHPIQRRTVRAYQLRDVVHLPWAGGQRVRDSEPGDHADRLGDEGSHGQLTHRDLR